MNGIYMNPPTATLGLSIRIFVGAHTLVDPSRAEMQRELSLFQTIQLANPAGFLLCLLDTEALDPVIATYCTRLKPLLGSHSRGIPL
ncbi:hypothetical protein VUR80DRAFT_8381 [Thermomyces stellatus]